MKFFYLIKIQQIVFLLHKFSLFYLIFIISKTFNTFFAKKKSTISKNILVTLGPRSASRSLTRQLHRGFRGYLHMGSRGQNPTAPTTLLQNFLGGGNSGHQGKFIIMYRVFNSDKFFVNSNKREKKNVFIVLAITH